MHFIVPDEIDILVICKNGMEGIQGTAECPESGKRVPAVDL